MITQEQKEEMIARFINNVLPHGSGIDCDWQVRYCQNVKFYCSGGKLGKPGQYIYITNSFHCMDENGMYDGYQDFSIRLDSCMFFTLIDVLCRADKYIAKDDMIKCVLVLSDVLADTFTLQFTNGNYKAEKYQLREYLEDTIAWDIRSAHTRLGIS